MAKTGLMKVKTKRLSDGGLQVGYKNDQGWIGLTNLRRTSYGHLGMGWASDNWSGIEKTITDWKNRIQKYVDNGTA